MGLGESGHKKRAKDFLPSPELELSQRPEKDFKKNLEVFGSNTCIFGRGDATVVEHPDAIKTYLVQQKNPKLDLTKLAKLRWIEKIKTPALCGVFGQRRSTIRQGIRTLRKCGISELNLTAEEKKPCVSGCHII